MTMNKFIIGIVALSLLLFSFPISALDYTIENNKVYIDDSHIFLSAEPHTLTESGYVYYNLTSKHFTGDIDICFGFNTLQCRPKNAEIWLAGSWINVSDRFTSINYNYDNLNKWYYITDLPITANIDYTLRVYQQINEISTGGKYGVAVKPSHETISQAISNDHFYYLDPWWDGDYEYRKEIILTGGASGAQTDYQLLLNITYDDDMQADFDDLRFTNDTIEINAWLENKTDSNYANVWIEFPTTPVNGVNQTYYMYYGNNSVSNLWDGGATFIQYHGATSSEFLDTPQATITDIVYECIGRIANSNSNCWFGLGKTMADNPVDGIILKLYFERFYRQAFNDSNGTNEYLPEGAAAVNTYYRFMIERFGTDAKYYVNEDLKSTLTTTLPDESIGLGMNFVDANGADQKWSFIRKYAANPPIYVFGTEETDVGISISLISFSPENLYQNYTGYTNISFGVDHSEEYALNLSSLAFLFGINYTIENNYTNTIRVPSNEICTIVNNSEKIFRNNYRNVSPFLSWENNDTITEGNIYKWGGADNDTSWVTSNKINDTFTYINISTSTMQIFPNMMYLGQRAMYEAPKTQFEISRAHSLIIKWWDLERINERDQNFTYSLFLDTDLKDAFLPNNDIVIYWANNSFNPLIDDYMTSPYCQHLETWNYTRWNTHVHTPHENASYCKPLVVNASLYTNPLPDATNYIILASGTVSSKPYLINVTNFDPDITNITFAETETLWDYNELSNTASAYAYTPSMFLTFNRNFENLEYHMYIANNQSLWTHSDIFEKSIGIPNYPPTIPEIHHFRVYCPYDDIWVNDTYIDATYNDGYLYINVQKGHDPDGGSVTHNLSLHYSNQTYITTLNSSFPDGNPVEINFSTIAYYSQIDSYTLKVNVTDDEGLITEKWLGKNFTLDADGSQGVIINDIVRFWGYHDLPTLYAAIGDENVLSYNIVDDIYTMHQKFFKSKLNDSFTINHTLHLKSLNLDTATYFRYRGNTNITDTSIHAWNTNTDSVAPITDDYRAYIKSFFAAHTHITNSELSNLGIDEYRQEGINYVDLHDLVINNSTLAYNSRGIIFEYCNAPTISNSSINNNVEVGIGIYTTNNSSIRDNNIIDNGRTGIRLYDTFNSIISDNIIDNSGFHGTWCQFSENNTYERNDVTNRSTGYYDYYFSSSSSDNQIKDPLTILNRIRSTSTSSVCINNTDNQVFDHTSTNSISYAYPNNFSLFMEGASETIDVTHYNMSITPNTDKLEINDIEWETGFNHPVTINTTSPVNITFVYFNITNSNWIQEQHGNNITIYRDNIEYSTDYFANEFGTLSYDYIEGYSSHKFKFQLTFTDEDLSTYASTKIVLRETLSTIQTFVDNTVRIIPFLIGGFVILFIIMIAGMITSTLKRW